MRDKMNDRKYETVTGFEVVPVGYGN
jgi:hypothetical protein